MWMWKDQHDEEMVAIGSKYTYHGKSRLVCHGFLHGDGIDEIFGEGTWLKLSTTPVEINVITTEPRSRE